MEVTDTATETEIDTEKTETAKEAEKDTQITAETETETEKETESMEETVTATVTEKKREKAATKLAREAEKKEKISKAISKRATKSLAPKTPKRWNRETMKWVPLNRKERESRRNRGPSRAEEEAAHEIWVQQLKSCLPYCSDDGNSSTTSTRDDDDISAGAASAIQSMKRKRTNATVEKDESHCANPSCKAEYNVGDKWFGCDDADECFTWVCNKRLCKNYLDEHEKTCTGQ
jgi:hypothetical protein